MRTRSTQVSSGPVGRTRVNLVRPVLPSLQEMAPEIEEVLTSGMVTKGKYLRLFEQAVAEHLGVEHVVGVSSCTTGLMLIYRCLGLSEVIVPSFTFMATVSSLVWAGARPVFADVDLHTHNLSPEAVEEAIGSRTSAIVATHLFGNPADVESLQEVAARHGLTLVFDAAHGFGTLRNGEPVGSQGNAQAFSLSPTKLLIAGEGGIVATNDGELAEQVRWGREYGNSGEYDSAFAGMNARMPEINAIMGLHSLRMLEAAARRRNELASLYRAELGRLPGIGFQRVRSEDRCSYKDFSITVDPDAFGLTRDELAAALAERNIDTRKYYDPPVHRQTAYLHLWDGRPLPNTDQLAERSLSLPLWSKMEDRLVLDICQAVREIYERSARERSL